MHLCNSTLLLSDGSLYSMFLLINPFSFISPQYIKALLVQLYFYSLSRDYYRVHLIEHIAVITSEMRNYIEEFEDL